MNVKSKKNRVRIRTKTDLKTESFRFFKALVVVIKLTQNCVGFTNPCVHSS